MEEKLVKSISADRGIVSVEEREKVSSVPFLPQQDEVSGKYHEE